MLAQVLHRLAPRLSIPSHRPTLPRGIERVSRLLDSSIGIQGTPFKMGVESVLGLFPVVGDAIPAAFSLYVVWRAHAMKLPKRTIAKMLGNIGLDFVVGSIPVIGDVFDVLFKANLRNLDLMERDLRQRGGLSLVPG